MNKFALFFSMMALFANVALANDGSSAAEKRPEPTKEKRQAMAELHEKMALCLKSDRPVSDCRSEMKQGCKDTHGVDGCPMEGGKMGRHMRHSMMDKHDNGKE